MTFPRRTTYPRPTGHPAEPKPLSTLGADARGTVFAEYVTLLVFISVGCVAATIALGVPLTNLFLFQRAILLLPIP